MIRRSYIKKKFKLHTYKSAKKRAWDMFSKYIRLRDCLKTMANPNYGRCYTCGKIFPFKALQAGHFVAGRSNAVLFDETCHSQCLQCNFYRGGEPLIFRRNLVKEFGEQKVQLLENKRYQVKKYSVVELDALYHHYKQEYLNLGANL